MSEADDLDWRKAVSEVDALIREEISKQAAVLDRRFNLSPLETEVITLASQLRANIIRSNDLTLKQRQAGRVGRWILSKRHIIPLEFGIKRLEMGWHIEEEPTVTTEPMFISGINTGDSAELWSFRLTSPDFRSEVNVGRDPSAHYDAHYSGSSLEVLNHKLMIDRKLKDVKENGFSVDINNHEITDGSLSVLKYDRWPNVERTEQLRSILAYAAINL